MKMTYLKALLLSMALASLFSTEVNAEEHRVIIGKGAFGVSLTSPMKEYIKVLGNPDGTIKMGRDRVGLVYGQKLLVIFWNDKLWEIVVWNKPPIHAFGYVRNGKDSDKFNVVLDGNIKLGMLREKTSEAVQAIKSKDKDNNIDADEFSMSFSHKNATLSFTFEYPSRKGKAGVNNQILREIQITFDENNPNIKK